MVSRTFAAVVWRGDAPSSVKNALHSRFVFDRVSSKHNSSCVCLKNYFCREVDCDFLSSGFLSYVFFVVNF